MSKLALHGGTPVLDEPLPQWPLRDEREEQAVLRVVRSGQWQYGTGDEGTAFEQEFAAWLGAPHAIATINGTETMTLALKAAGIGPGDEVIMPTLTFIACPLAVLNAGAVPVLCDIDPATLTMAPDAVSAEVTTRTKAILAVSLYGIPPDMDALGDLAARRALVLLEDVAQAQGTQWRGRNVGTIGDFGSFSFQTAKAMMSGDGGMVTCQDRAAADLVRAYREFGSPRPEYAHHEAVVGGNYRLSEFQSAIGRVQLKRVLGELGRKAGNVAAMAAGLADLEGLQVLRPDPRVTRVNYVGATLLYRRERMMGVPRDVFLSALQAEGVSFSIGYSTLLHEQPLLDPDRLRRRDHDRFLGRPVDYRAGAFPNACRCRDSVTIRMSQQWVMGEESFTAKVIEAIRKVVGRLDDLR